MGGKIKYEYRIIGTDTLCSIYKNMKPETDGSVYIREDSGKSYWINQNKIEKL